MRTETTELTFVIHEEGGNLELLLAAAFGVQDQRIEWNPIGRASFPGQVFDVNLGAAPLDVAVRVGGGIPCEQSAQNKGAAHHDGQSARPDDAKDWVTALEGLERWR
jgi:hypothetical protein